MNHQAQIEGKLSQKSEGLDISYWESLLSQLKAHTARARLRDKHQQNLRYLYTLDSHTLIEKSAKWYKIILFLYHLAEFL